MILPLSSFCRYSRGFSFNLMASLMLPPRRLISGTKSLLKIASSLLILCTLEKRASSSARERSGCLPRTAKYI